MTPEVQTLWDSVESRKWRIMEALARLPEAAQSASAKGRWSPRQVVLHLILAEEQLLREVEAAEGRTELPGPNWLLKAVVWTLRKGIRVPAPASMVPGEAPELPVLIARWEHVRERLRARLAQATDSRPFSVHGVLGPLSTEQALEVTDAHLQYHLRDVGA